MFIDLFVPVDGACRGITGVCRRWRACVGWLACHIYMPYTRYSNNNVRLRGGWCCYCVVRDFFLTFVGTVVVVSFFLSEVHPVQSKGKYTPCDNESCFFLS